MPKPPQILLISPQSEIKFQGPFTQSVTRYLRVANPSEKAVLYKIKTTAPKRYFVRPSSGILNDKEYVEVAICLRPFDYDPDDKTKHKFMVQSLIVPAGVDLGAEDVDIAALWKDAQAEEIMDTKLKCSFEIPEYEVEQSSEPEPEAYSTDDNQVSKIYHKALENDEVDQSSLEPSASERLRLEEEEARLSEENRRLMDQLLELREEGNENFGHDIIESSKSPSYMFLTCLAIAVIVCLLGIFAGKFFT